MKNAVLLIACFAGLTTEINAQDSTASPRKRRTHFEVIAGPTFFRSENPFIFPTLKYQVGVTGIHRLKRSFVQVSLQYLPIAATFSDRGYYFKFSNHVVAASLLSKLPFTRKKRLTIDLGVSYGVTVAQSDNYRPVDYSQGIVCYNGGALPIRNKTHFLLLAGASWRYSDRYTIGVLNGFGPPMKDGYTLDWGYSDDSPAYYMLQAWFGYRI